MMKGIEVMLNEREGTHGSFLKQNALALKLFRLWYQDSSIDVSKDEDAAILETIHMVMVKLSRMAAGDVRYLDHIDDIIGYLIKLKTMIGEKV